MTENIFTYQVTKSGKIFIFWGGKRIKILDGNGAQKFKAKIDRLDEENAQLVMAKETGNFKRDNERQGKFTQGGVSPGHDFLAICDVCVCRVGCR